MKWKSEYEWGRTCWNGRHNNIKFEIAESYEGYSCTDLLGYYAIVNSVKNEDIAFNTLWIGDKFKTFNTLEEAQDWCEKLTIDNLIQLREKGLKK